MSRSSSPRPPTDDGSCAPGEPDHPRRESDAGGQKGGVGGRGGGVVVGMGGSPRGVAGAHYGRYVALLGVLLVVVFTLHTVLGSHKGAAGLRVGSHIPPFAAPLAIGGPVGEVDVATRPNEGAAGKHPACTVRGAGILNICQLYEHRPVVLALFFDAGACASVLERLQRLAPLYPKVSFVAVAVNEDAGSVVRLVRSRRITIPVGVDADGRLAGLYTMVSCPQIMFVAPGGLLRSAPLLSTPSDATLAARVGQLLPSSKSTVR